MKGLSETKAVTIREFVGLVRAKLDASGHEDIAVERIWVEEDEVGETFVLNVPVGPELFVPLRPTKDFFESSTIEIDLLVGQTAQALVNLRRAEKFLVAYARDVRKAAIAEIVAARAEGLDLQLERVGFKPTMAFHLSGSDWEDAAHHVLAALTVRHTSLHLRPNTTELWVEEPGDVAKELADLRAEQRERQDRLVEMEAIGADLEVDAITLDLLEAHGIDAAQTLREVWRRQCVNLPVETQGQRAHLSLITSNGIVTASFDVGGAFWNGEHLWFNGDGEATGHDGLVGACLGDLVHHPVFSSRKIVNVERSHGGLGRDLISFDLSDKLLFDADTGRLWRRERLAA